MHNCEQSLRSMDADGKYSTNLLRFGGMRNTRARSAGMPQTIRSKGNGTLNEPQRPGLAKGYQFRAERKAVS